MPDLPARQSICDEGIRPSIRQLADWIPAGVYPVLDTEQE